MEANIDKMKKSCNICMCSAYYGSGSGCYCNLKEQATKYVTEHKLQNSRTFRIGICRPNQIGLSLNTKVNLKSKNKWNCKNSAITLLICLLFAHVIWAYMRDQRLSTQIQMTLQRVDELADKLLITNYLYDQVLEKLEQMEQVVGEKNVVHRVQKREVEMQPLDHNITRQARSVGRGKHTHSKNRNGCRLRCCQTSGPVSIHLKGSMTQISVRDGGIIAPWTADETSSGMFKIADGLHGAGKGIVEIVEEGLYLIYAQVYYLTNSSMNSYAINLELSTEWGRKMLVIATCSAEAAFQKISELSCYTAVVRFLYCGDRIFIVQKERERKILFRDNRSFLGLTLLNTGNKKSPSGE